MGRTPIEPRKGAHVTLKAKDSLKICNPHGTQVIDTWAFAPISGLDYTSTKDNTGPFAFRYLSMSHTRSSAGSLRLSPGDVLRDNARDPVLTLLEDTSGGVHDMLFAGCDAKRYKQLGIRGHHGSCKENLEHELGQELGGEVSTAVREAASKVNEVIRYWDPDPLNFFTNAPVTSMANGHGGELSLKAPICPRGGYVTLRAEVDCVVVMSACPMDLNVVNGWENMGGEFEIVA